MKNSGVSKIQSPEKEIKTSTLWIFELSQTLIRFSVIVLLGWLISAYIGLNTTWIAITAFLGVINTIYTFTLFFLRKRIRKSFRLLKWLHHLSIIVCLVIFSMIVIITGREKSDYFLLFVFYLTIIPLTQIDFPFEETAVSEILISSAYPISIFATGLVKETGIFITKTIFLMVIATANITLSWILKRKHSLLLDANYKLHLMAITDPLTQLYNRSFLQEQLSREVARSKISRNSVSIIVCDIDNFKSFNDEFGHIEGDNMLIQISEIIKSEVRQVDTVARFGGEEFVIILPSTSKKEATVVAERIRKNIEALSEEKFRKRITLTFGVASFPEDARDEIELLRRADRVLLEAKLAGKNRVEICRGMLG